MSTTRPREVLLSEFREAGEEGMKLLNLATRLGVDVYTSRDEYFDPSKGSAPHPYTSYDVVWFEGRNVTLYEGDRRTSGIKGGSKDGGVPEALKKLFHQVAKPGAVIDAQFRSSNNIRRVEVSSTLGFTSFQSTLG